MLRSARLMMTGVAAFGIGTLAALAGCLTVGDLQGRWRLVEIQSQPMKPAAEHKQIGRAHV